MIQINFIEMIIFITLLWVLVRFLVYRKTGKLSVKRELQLILVYICIVVISRIVYFPLHLVDGHVAPLKFDASRIFPFRTSFRPFFFLKDRYKGWRTNVIGNMAMFIPFGIVWPLCFKKLNKIWKVILAGFSYTLLIEISQLPFYERCSDVDDLILNTTGVVIGAVIYFGILKIIQIVKRRLLH